MKIDIFLLKVKMLLCNFRKYFNLLTYFVESPVDRERLLRFYILRIKAFCQSLFKVLFFLQGAVKHTLHGYLFTVFPHIVFSLEYFPPLITGWTLSFQTLKMCHLWLIGSYYRVSHGKVNKVIWLC